MIALLLVATLLSPFRVENGPYAGAYRVAPTGAVNWYFASSAFLRLQHLPVPQTREYLDVYVAHLDPYYGIADVLPQPTGIFAPIAPDSDDAYAATFLSLASRYVIESGDRAWWARNVATLKAMAYAKIVTQIKPNGLVRDSATNANGYLMDNAENYAGLHAFAAMLETERDPQAPYFSAFVRPLGEAIHRLYDVRARVFRWSDSEPVGAMVAYPSCIAQVYPQFFAVASGSRSADERRFLNARRALVDCAFSAAENPHEALAYALFLTTLRDRTSHEDERLRMLLVMRPALDDLISVSLYGAVHRNDKSPV